MKFDFLPEYSRFNIQRTTQVAHQLDIPESAVYHWTLEREKSINHLKDVISNTKLSSKERPILHEV